MTFVGLQPNAGIHLFRVSYGIKTQKKKLQQILLLWLKELSINSQVFLDPFSQSPLFTAALHLPSKP